MPIWPAFKQSPLEAPPVVKLRNPPHCTVGNADLSRTTPHIYSGKLVYAAEWMRKTKKYFSGEEEAEKRSRKKSSLKGGGRKSHDEKRWGQVFAQARLGF